MLPALILSAGNSSRMGIPKALLADGEGAIFITRIVQTLVDAGIEDVVIVTGRHHDAIRAALHTAVLPIDPRIIRNPDPDRGQLSSLLTGLAEVSRDETEALVVTLVDVPMVRSATVRQVIDAWRRTRAPVVRPAVGLRHGHPVVFDRAMFDELRAAPLDLGARTVVRAHYDEIVNVPVEDRGCLVDVDTPDDYRSLLHGAETLPPEGR